MEHDFKHLIDRSHRRTDASAWSTASPGGVVAAAHYRAAEAGSRMLAAGGNAVDAAIAASLALNVCEPAGSGLGGMAMMLVYHRASDRVFAPAGPMSRAPRRGPGGGRRRRTLSRIRRGGDARIRARVAGRP